MRVWPLSIRDRTLGQRPDSARSCTCRLASTDFRFPPFAGGNKMSVLVTVVTGGGEPDQASRRGGAFAAVAVCGGSGAAEDYKRRLRSGVKNSGKTHEF